MINYVIKSTRYGNELESFTKDIYQEVIILQKAYDESIGKQNETNKTSFISQCKRTEGMKSAMKSLYKNITIYGFYNPLLEGVIIIIVIIIISNINEYSYFWMFERESYDNCVIFI